MTPPRGRSAGGFFRSLGCAARGVTALLAAQPNARIHLVATAVVLVLAVALHLSIPDWCWIIAAIGGVWVAEALNTAIECVTDLASPEVHPLAGRAKDVAAGAVLLAALVSACIGLLVLGPRAWVAWGPI